MVASYRLCYRLPPLVSLLLGFFQGSGTTRATEDLPMDWIEVVTILVAIFIVALVGSWNNRRSDSRCPTRRENFVAEVIRNGPERMIHTHDVIIGLPFEPGDLIPCNDIFLSGHNGRYGLVRRAS